MAEISIVYINLFFYITKIINNIYSLYIYMIFLYYFVTKNIQVFLALAY